MGVMFMKNKIIRILSFSLITLIMVSLFAGCGKDEAESPTNVSSIQSNPTIPTTNNGANLEGILQDDQGSWPGDLRPVRRPRSRLRQS